MRFMPLIERMISIIDKRISPDAKEQATEIKNDLKIRLSLDLKPITIEKSIIEINIKNSTITRITNNVNDNPIEIFSVTSVENKNLIVAVKFGPTYIIKSEITKLANPVKISINAVIYFEFMSCFFVTGRVWVR